MQYRSVADLNDAVLRNVRRLPRGIDLVVGIPRSGLLAGNLLSLALNLPLTDPDGLLARRLLSAGRTRRHAGMDLERSAGRKIVLVDDTIQSGQSMREMRDRIAAAGRGFEVVTCAVYGPRSTHPDADLVLEAVPQPRLFQWNVMHHALLGQACVDIDGVLCCDPTAAENDDGPAYRAFLLGAAPLLVPTLPIGVLVTSRLEKYRPETEAWLESAGIRYGRLVMLDLASREERLALRGHGAWKADIYRRSDALLFIESEQAQAQEIARIAGKPVLCIESQTMIAPDPLSPIALAQSVRLLPARLRAAHSPLTSLTRLKLAARGLLGQAAYDQVKGWLRPGRRRA